MNKWIFRLIGLVATVASPEIRKGADDLLDKLEADAKKTANPWDDMLVDLLRTLFSSK